MDEKDETPPPGEKPESAQRVVRGEGNIRSRERSFSNQRAATLRPSDELEGEASSTTAPEAERDNTGNEHNHALQSGEGRQNLIAQYRRRERKKDEMPNEGAREDRAPTHISSPDSSDSPDDDVDPP
jgi:hypothetical protein